MRFSILIGLALATVLGGTATAAPDGPGGSTALVSHYAELVRAAYVDTLADARRLETSIGRLLERPTERRLRAARRAWSRSRLSYGVTEAFRFYEGPIDGVDPRTGEAGPELRLNAWPVNEALIDRVVGGAGGDIVHDPEIPIDRETLTGMNGVHDETDVTTGYHAIEFLLWGQDLAADGPGRRPASDFEPGDPFRERRREYLRVVTSLLIDDLSWLVEAWDPSRDTFGASFLRAPAHESLAMALTGLVQLVGFEMSLERLAVPLDSGDQEDEHSCFSDTTHLDFVANTRGVRRVWFGRDRGHHPAGFAAALREVDPELEQRIAEELTRTERAIAAFEPPFDEMLRAADDDPRRRHAETLVETMLRLADLLGSARARLSRVDG